MFLLRMILACFTVCLSLCVCPAGAQEAEEGSSAVSVAYFDFSVDHGEAWRDKADYQKLYCSVQNGKTGDVNLILFSAGEVSNNYRGPVGDEIFAGLTELAAGFRLDSWANFGSGKLYTGSPEWSLTVRFSDGREIKAGGLLAEKKPLNFDEAEKGIAVFFKERAAACRAQVSRRIESFSFEVGPAMQAQELYSIHVSLNQRSVMVMFHGEKEDSIADFSIDTAAFKEFSELLLKYRADSWHAYKGVQDGSSDDFRMQLKYDTFETVEVEGSLKLQGGAPERFGDFAGALRAYFDKYRRMYVQSRRPKPSGGAENVGEFFFSVSGASKLDHQSYQISEVMTPDGVRCAMVAEKFCDDDLTVEFVLSDDDLAELQALSERLNLKAWDGFRGYKRGVRDGRGFSLIIVFAGKEIRARGYAAFPPDYESKSRELLKSLDGIAERRRKVKTAEKYEPSGAH